MYTDLQLDVVHGVGVGGVELRVVGRVQQLDDQVSGQQLRHKRMLKKEATCVHLTQEMILMTSGLTLTLCLTVV